MKSTKGDLARARRMVNILAPEADYARAMIQALSEWLEEEWLKPGEFSLRVGVHPNTVRNWVKEDRVRHRLLPSGYCLIHVTEVERVLSIKNTRTQPPVLEAISG